VIKFTVKADLLNPNMFKLPCSVAESVVANQVLKDTRPFVPALTMSLNNRSYVQGNMVIYPGPYARYLYYGKAMKNAVTGKGPMYIPEVGYRWPKGATLIPTDRNLVFTTSVHPQAQAHWFEASKAQNMEKWEKVAEKAVKENL